MDETLDLHGFSASEARTHLPPFLEAARRRHPGGLIHLITGRGRGSGGAPVLPRIVRKLLREDAGALVAAWGPDPHGGGFMMRLR